MSIASAPIAATWAAAERIIVGVLAEQLDRHGPAGALARVDAQHLRRRSCALR